MSTSTKILSPSIWMQQNFFDIAQQIRESPIGNPPKQSPQAANLQIRIAAIVHAILQLSYAAVAIVPLTCITTIIIVTAPPSTKLTEEEQSKLALCIPRTLLAILLSITSLVSPIFGAVRIAFCPQDLDEKNSASICLPISSQSALLGYTLPNLHHLPFLTKGALFRTIQGMASEHFQDVPDLMEDLTQSAQSDDPFSVPLETLNNHYFGWRKKMSAAVVSQVVDQNLFSTYKKIFDGALLEDSSDRDLITSITTALIAASRKNNSSS